jgi:sugar phosphate isomerase/epimerase
MKERQIYVSTACLKKKQALTSRLELYLENKIDFIELGAGVSVTDEELIHLQNRKCHFLVHNYFPPPPEAFVLNLASKNEEIRQKSLDLVYKALDLSAKLGAPFYSVHAGFITDPIITKEHCFIFPYPDSPDESKESIERFITTLELILDHSKNHDIKVLVENNVCTNESKGKLLLQTIDEFKYLFDNIESSNLGILLDFGHLNVTSKTFKFNRKDFLKQLGHHIGGFHVHENNGEIDSHQPISDDSWVLDTLKEPIFSNTPLVIEAKFDDVEHLKLHFDWLKDKLSK